MNEIINERESSFRNSINHLYERLNQSSFLERDEIKESISFLEREIEDEELDF